MHHLASGSLNFAIYVTEWDSLKHCGRASWWQTTILHLSVLRSVSFLIVRIHLLSPALTNWIVGIIFKYGTICIRHLITPTVSRILWYFSEYKHLFLAVFAYRHCWRKACRVRVSFSYIFHESYIFSKPFLHALNCKNVCYRSTFHFRLQYKDTRSLTLLIWCRLPAEGTITDKCLRKTKIQLAMGSLIHSSNLSISKQVHLSFATTMFDFLPGF